MTAQDAYQRVKSMPASERLELAKLILQDIPAQSFVDYSGEWSDEDLKDFTTASWKKVEERSEGIDD